MSDDRKDSTEAAAGELTDEHIEDVLAEHGVDFYTNGKVDGQASDLFAGVRALLRASSATASEKEGALVERLRAESFQLTDAAADLIEQQAARIAELEAENRELGEFVVAVGGFWGESKSKLIGELSLAEVINRAFSDSADSAMANLFEVLMQQNIVTGAESYLSLKYIGMPPTEAEFVRAVQRVLDAAIAASERKNTGE